MSKYEAFEQLTEIKNQIDELAEEAAAIMREKFPDEYQSASAYDVFNMTGSWNSYNVTFESSLESIENYALNGDD